MNKHILLTVGGVIQVLIALLHITIFIGIESSAELSASVKTGSHIFNAAVLTTVIFFAYVSFFCKVSLLSTGLGRITAVFISFFYLQRGIVEVFLKGIKPVNLILALIIAGLYIIIALPEREVKSGIKQV